MPLEKAWAGEENQVTTTESVFQNRERQESRGKRTAWSPSSKTEEWNLTTSPAPCRQKAGKMKTISRRWEKPYNEVKTRKLINQANSRAFGKIMKLRINQLDEK